MCGRRTTYAAENEEWKDAIRLAIPERISQCPTPTGEEAWRKLRLLA